MASTSLMHLLAVVDEHRRREEGPALKTLLNGIQEISGPLTEILATPGTREDLGQGLSTEHPLAAPMPVNWLQRSRVRDGLLRNLGRQLPDVVVSFGEDAATLSADLAQALDCPLLVECWKASHAKRPPVRPNLVAGYVTTSAGLATTMRDRSLHELIVTAPFPVAMPPRTKDPPGSTPSVAILDADADPNGARAILDAVRLVVKDLPDLQVCLELGQKGSNSTWRYAESIGLLDCISSVTNAASMGPLVSDCTLTLLASSSCCTRSIVDLAMARGRVVVRPDHALLTDSERTYQCILLEPTPDQWARTMLDLLQDSQRMEDLGKAARGHVARRNDPDVVYSTWTQLLHEVGKDITYPFASTGTSPGSS